MVAAGVYNEDITLPYYNRTTGVINIVGDNVTLQGAIALAGQGVGRYNLRGFSIEFAGRPSPGSVGWYGIFALEGTSMVLSDVTIDMKNESTGILKSCIRSQGSVSINQNCVFKGNGARFWYSEGGKIYLNRDCLCEGTVSLGTVGVSSLGIFGVTTTANGGVRPVISGTVTGKRYAVSGFSVISTASGGKEYFPGTLPGSNENGVYDGIFEKP